MAQLLTDLLAVTGFLALAYMVASQTGAQRAAMIRKYIMSLYLTDEVRRVMTESVGPFFLKKYAERHDPLLLILGEPQKPRAGVAGAQREVLERRRRMRASASSERTKPAYDSYEAFNDYLEMVMQFAYVSLWSHCELPSRIYLLSLPTASDSACRRDGSLSAGAAVLDRPQPRRAAQRRIQAVLPLPPRGAKAGRPLAAERRLAARDEGDCGGLGRHQRLGSTECPARH